MNADRRWMDYALRLGRRDGNAQRQGGEETGKETAHVRETPRLTPIPYAGAAESGKDMDQSGRVRHGR